MGRAVDSISKDPLRAAVAVATGGVSEAVRAVDQDLVNKRNAAHDKQKEIEKQASDALAEQDEIKRKGKLTEQRDIQRAKSRAAGANAGGRSSTILTDPSSYGGGSASLLGGRKTLLGS